MSMRLRNKFIHHACSCFIIIFIHSTTTLAIALESHDNSDDDSQSSMILRHRILQGGGGGGGDGDGDGVSGEVGGGGNDAVGLVLLMIFLPCAIIHHIRAQREAEKAIVETRRQNIAWVKEESTSDRKKNPSCGTEESHFPSGMWRGYYHQYSRDHSLFAFQLEFDAGRNTIRGEGHDEVGRYSIDEGYYNRRNGRLCFTKKYQKDVGSNTNSENLGHEVEYSGALQGSAAAGVRGQWFVATYKYRGEGVFHIWPMRFGEEEEEEETPSRATMEPDVTSEVRRRS